MVTKKVHAHIFCVVVLWQQQLWPTMGSNSCSCSVSSYSRFLSFTRSLYGFSFLFSSNKITSSTALSPPSPFPDRWWRWYYVICRVLGFWRPCCCMPLTYCCCMRMVTPHFWCRAVVPERRSPKSFARASVRRHNHQFWELGIRSPHRKHDFGMQTAHIGVQWQDHNKDKQKSLSPTHSNSNLTKQKKAKKRVKYVRSVGKDRWQPHQSRRGKCSAAIMRAKMHSFGTF